MVEDREPNECAAVVGERATRENGSWGRHRTRRAVPCPVRRQVRKGRLVPLSEDEQRILQEMEQKLYEGDRSFAGRVRARHPIAHRPLRWAVAVFIAGFAVVLLSFRSSLLLATFGFVVMLLAALTFERSMRQSGSGKTERPATKGRIADDLSSFARRVRSRLFQHH